MEDSATDASQSLSADSDICQQLLTRYARSSAAQHRHLCACAAATRSIIQSSALPLTPISYFAATITSISDSENLDADTLGALTSFLSILLPLVGGGGIKADKAGEAVRVLVRTVEGNGTSLGTSGVRAVVKCVGVLLADYCDLNEWESVSLGFEWLLKFSRNRRPKVRKCAVDCLLTVFKSFKSSVISKANKLMYKLLKDFMPVAREMTTLNVVDGLKEETLLRPEHQEVLHMLNVMKHVIPHLSPKILAKILAQLLKILTSKFYVATRHIFDVISVIFLNSGTDVIISNAEKFFTSLISYISFGENPVDSVLFAATLGKTALCKLHDGDKCDWVTYFPMLTKPLVGLLSCQADTASQVSTILRELIEQHIDAKNFNIDGQDMEGNTTDNAEFRAIETSCSVVYNTLCASSQIPNDHVLSVVSFLFIKLGEKSDILMKPTLLKLSDLINTSPANAPERKHLEGCIGSAVAAMGPEKLLMLLPISFNSKDASCTNIWLIPILREYIVGSSLRFFMEHIVPLAESLEKESYKVKKSVIGRDLQAYAHACWGLFPAFCRHPSDAFQSFGALANLLISVIKKGSFMLENIAVGLQGLVQLMESDGTQDKNMKPFALCANGLLQALIDVFFETPPEAREHLKGAIQCLGSLCDASSTKRLFMASLEKYQLLDVVGEDGEAHCNPDGPVKGKESSVMDEKRCLVLDLASCIVEGSDDDVVNLLFSVIKCALQSSNETVQIEAYQTLSKVLEKNSLFCCSQFDVVMDLFAGKKCAPNAMMLKKRFACFQSLLIHALMRDIDEENTKAFLILNEIILASKDSDDEGRKAAYDVLIGVSSKLRSSSDNSLDGLYQKLLTVITGYLSGSSPQIKSGVVSALSVLVYNDPGICISMPDVVPAVMELLHSKAIEVIKAVLGFVKVLVSCLKPNDLQPFLSDIVDGVIRWSSVSRHHLKAKVVVILEIMIRKCGSAAMKALTPEKYKDFVQSVIKNRRGKASHEEDGSEETRQEVSGSSPQRHQKRKRDESKFSSNEGGFARPGKRKNFRTANSGNLHHKGGRHSDHSNPQGVKPNKPRGGNARGSKENLSHSNKQKEKMTPKKKNWGSTQKPERESRFQKQKMGRRKDRKTVAK